MDEPGGVDDDAPISEFSKDIGRWYDHDFIWMEASNQELPVIELCKLNGIDSDELINAIAARSKTEKVKSLIILWNSRIISEDTRLFAKGEMYCLGSWEHTSPLTD